MGMIDSRKTMWHAHNLIESTCASKSTDFPRELPFPEGDWSNKQERLRLRIHAVTDALSTVFTDLNIMLHDGLALVRRCPASICFQPLA